MATWIAVEMTDRNAVERFALLSHLARSRQRSRFDQRCVARKKKQEEVRHMFELHGVSKFKVAELGAQGCALC